MKVGHVFGRAKVVINPAETKRTAQIGSYERYVTLVAVFCRFLMSRRHTYQAYLECNLQAAAPHAERHRVHVHVGAIRPLPLPFLCHVRLGARFFCRCRFANAF